MGILATNPLMDLSQKNMFNYFYMNYSLEAPIESVTTLHWISASSDSGTYEGFNVLGIRMFLRGYNAMRISSV